MQEFWQRQSNLKSKVNNKQLSAQYSILRRHGGTRAVIDLSRPIYRRSSSPGVREIDARFPGCKEMRHLVPNKEKCKARGEGKK